MSVHHRPSSLRGQDRVESTGVDSDLEVSAIDIRIECDAPPDCIDGVVFLPMLLAPPRLVHGDGSSVALPWPALIDEGDPTYHEYRWLDLDLPIVDHESFTLEFSFDSPLDVARITRLDVRVGGALPSTCTAGGQPGGAEPPLCRMVSPFIDLGP